MAMKINLMEREIGKYGKDDIDSSVYTQAPKGKKPYKSALGALAIFGLTAMTPACYADSTSKEVTSVQAPAPKDSVNKNTPHVTQISNQKVAQKKAEAAVQEKKIRILVKAFEASGETQSKETKYFEGSTRTAYSEDEGATIKAAIESELIGSERKGLFNRKGLYAIVEDTERPDSEEAELAVKGIFRKDGGQIYFFAELVKTRTGEIVYTDNLTLPDSPGNVPLGGEFIAVGLNNYLQ